MPSPARILDIVMLVNVSGKERTREDDPNVVKEEYHRGGAGVI